MGARYILALVLMVAVIVIWTIVSPHIFKNSFGPQPNEPTTTETPIATSPSETPPDAETPSASDGTEASVDADLWTPIQETPEDAKVNVRTDNYSIVFNEKLAIARKWQLNHFPDRSDVDKVPMNLIPENALSCLALRFANSQLELDALRATWKADKSEIDITNGQKSETLTLRAPIGEKLQVTKQFTFNPGTYFVDMTVTFQNVSDEPLLMGGNEPANGYQLQWGRGISADLLPYEKRSGNRGRHGEEGAKAYISGNKPKRELKPEQAMAPVLWAGMDSKYFSALMIPDQQLGATYKFIETPEANTDITVSAPTQTAALVLPSFVLAAQAKEMHAFRLYVGPKDDTILKGIEAPNASEDSILNLSKIIDFGFFGVIAWGMLWIFKGLHGVFGNYGISIILLTALVKVISYPFTRKAHKSMKEMQKLQPQLVELKEKYRDDPQKLNRATMRLYKERGVNPLGGCIPWLPQIPIFWALFALLGSAVELRGAPFLLWIDDLSAPDTLVELPFTIPLIVTEIDAIRLLPIINGLTTWLQQKFVGNMTPTTDNMQAKLMQFMPLIFIFIFYNWASGFVLYWLCNNVFTIAQQYLQNRSTADEDQIASADTKRRNNPKQK